MKAVLDYLKARATEVSSILAASGALGTLVLYLSGEMTGHQAIGAAAAAVVAYLYPQAKKLPPAAPALFAIVFAGSLVACSTTAPDGTALTFAQQVAAFDAKAKSDLATFGADSLVVGKSACGYVSEASGLFRVVAPIAGADPAALAAGAAAAIAADAACRIIDAADPAKPAAPQVVTAVAQVLAAVPAVKSALEATDPAVAAAATAP